MLPIQLAFLIQHQSRFGLQSSVCNEGVATPQPDWHEEQARNNATKNDGGKDEPAIRFVFRWNHHSAEKRFQDRMART